jgi:hypothetical protein
MRCPIVYMSDNSNISFINLKNIPEVCGIHDSMHRMYILKGSLHFVFLNKNTLFRDI